ncbi:MgtC/SapB family protein [Planctomycetota bacterium]
MLEFLNISPLTWNDIACCIIAAAVIGFERQVHGKPIGIRTSGLICLGTYLFVVMGQSIATDHMDPSRIVGQVITGVGFLGAGIMFARNDTVVGVTSAAAIWILAAIGVTIGQGHAWLGVKIAVLTTLLLTGVNLLESSFSFLQQGVHRRLDRRRQTQGKTDTQENVSE